MESYVKIYRYPSAMVSNFNLTLIEKLLSLVVTPDGFNCMILCKRSESKIVDMVKVTKHAKHAPVKSIRYNNDENETLKAKLSKDMKCCYINN